MNKQYALPATDRPDILAAAGLVPFPEICRRIGWTRSQLSARIRSGSAQLELVRLPDCVTLFATASSAAELARRTQTARQTGRKLGQVTA